MAKSAAKKKSASADAAQSTTRNEPHVVDVEEVYTYGVRLTLSDGDKLDLLGSGGGSFEANKEIRARAIAAIKATLSLVATSWNRSAPGAAASTPADKA